jgi:hypothetical protein
MRARSYIFLAGALLLGFGGGRLTSTPTPAVAPVATLPLTKEKRPVQLAQTIIVKPSSFSSRLNALMGGKDRLQRIRELLELVTKAGPEELRKLENWARSYDMAPELRIILFAEGRADGRNTIQRLFSGDANQAERVEGIVAEGWATVEPTAAWQWWCALPECNLRSSLFPFITQGLGAAGHKLDPSALLGLSKIELRDLMSPAIDMIVNGEGLEAALDWVISVSSIIPHEPTAYSHEVTERAQLELIRHLETRPDAHTIQRLLDISQELGPAASLMAKAMHNDVRRTKLSHLLGKSQGEAAIQWYLEPGRERLAKEYMGSAAWAWAAERPAEVLQLLEHQPQHPEHDRIAFCLVTAQKKTDPVLARRVMAMVRDPEMRETLARVFGDDRR